VSSSSRWASYLEHLKSQSFLQRTGQVRKVSSLVIESIGPAAFVGELCEILDGDDRERLCYAEVIGLRDHSVMLMPFGETRGICTSSQVVGTDRTVKVPVGDWMLGRVIDPLGAPLDGKAVEAAEGQEVRGAPKNPLSRAKIEEVFETGIRAIDVFLPLGQGQRMGIFAGSGVGKSTLLGMIARDSVAEVNVIALIGERGREVGDFLTKALGEEGLRKSVVVVATSDQPALLRELAAHTATAIAEFFCTEGKNVLLIMDSVTRFAMAHREIGLSLGEPATARGYTPSSFAAMPKLLERVGRFGGGGTITAIYTVLVEGDDLHEPVSDNMRAILDGHIVLSRDLANSGRYPAIDVLKSISRVASDLWTSRQRDAVRKALRLLSTWERYRDMIDIGAYRQGSNAEVDQAITFASAFDEFVRQDEHSGASREEAFQMLERILPSSSSR